MKIDKNKFGIAYAVFSSGRRSYVNNGIIGISPEGKIYVGYDGSFDFDLTPEERQELADYMIEQWTKFKNASPSS